MLITVEKRKGKFRNGFILYSIISLKPFKTFNLSNQSRPRPGCKCKHRFFKWHFEFKRHDNVSHLIISLIYSLPKSNYTIHLLAVFLPFFLEDETDEVRTFTWRAPSPLRQSSRGFRVKTQEPFVLQSFLFILQLLPRLHTQSLSFFFRLQPCWLTLFKALYDEVT